MSSRDDILMEHVWHELQAIREGQEAMASVPGDVAQLKDDMVEVKGEILAIKRVVKEHSGILEEHWRRHKGHSQNETEIRRWLQAHDGRIARIEQAA